MTEETEQKKGGECSECIHCYGWEYHRFPPVIHRQSYFTDDGRYQPTEFGFSQSGTKCGEYEEEEKI